uniref:Uncharacterized protein n=1 Tax=Lotus japonicus TaxID=34305 RepID=I3T0V9_LOTJA|nr:unknown [Lotus japonicus]
MCFPPAMKEFNNKHIWHSVLPCEPLQHLLQLRPLWTHFVQFEDQWIGTELLEQGFHLRRIRAPGFGINNNRVISNGILMVSSRREPKEEEEEEEVHMARVKVGMRLGGEALMGEWVVEMGMEKVKSFVTEDEEEDRVVGREGLKLKVRRVRVLVNAIPILRF